MCDERQSPARHPPLQKEVTNTASVGSLAPPPRARHLRGRVCSCPQWRLSSLAPLPPFPSHLQGLLACPVGMGLVQRDLEGKRPCRELGRLEGGPPGTSPRPDLPRGRSTGSHLRAALSFQSGSLCYRCTEWDLGLPASGLVPLMSCDLSHLSNWLTLKVTQAHSHSHRVTRFQSCF